MLVCVIYLLVGCYSVISQLCSSVAPGGTSTQTFSFNVETSGVEYNSPAGGSICSESPGGGTVCSKCE